MGYEIPVSFGPVDRAQLPATLNKWYDALPLLEAQFSKPVSQRLYEARSSNNVDLNIIQQMCVDHALHGLTFLNEEVSCLCGDALAQADTTLDALVDVILNGTQALNAGWNLTPDARALLTDDTHPIDRERKAEDNLPGFLRLLRRAVREVIAQQRCLLFVAPQP
jgi:hypothetical protein